MARDARRACLVVGIVFALSLAAVTPRIYASDEIEYFAFLRSLWFDRDLSFDNEYRYFYERGVAATPDFHETFLERTTETGRRLNFGTIGCALLWLPFYAVAHAVTVATGAWPADGYSTPYLVAVACASALYGLAAVALAVLAARRLLARAGLAGSLAVPAAAALVWVGTPLVFYTHVAPPMSHATAAFAVAAFTLTWLRVRDRWTLHGFAALGALAGLMTIVREQDAFFAVGPAVDLLWTRKVNEVGRLARGLAIALAAFALVFLPQALAYLTLNGRIGPSRLVSRKMTWTSPHAAAVLLSPEHGFFVWTPLAAVALAGLLVLWLRPDTRAAAAALAAMAAAQVYVAGSVESWTVAGAFGQRRFVSLTVVLICGLAALLAVPRSRPARAAIAASLALATWWNVGLIAQFGAGLMNRQRLELPAVARNNFLVVPVELPRLAYRYLFHRETFYRPRSRSEAR